MCGIVGYAGFSPGEETNSQLNRMLDAIFHRGPDDGGHLIHSELGIGMRRLSIIDLSTGHQPMETKNGRYAIVFNGEIYNYPELTKQLQSKGYHFQTKTDTEVILHLYQEYGADCVHHLRGMFAFAIIDKQENTLFIARDRLGIKPLYFWRQGKRFVFASEIKAILECPSVERAPNLRAIDSYLSLRYVPGPESMFAGIHKFPAASRMLWHNGEAKFETYWTPPTELDQPLRSDSDYLDAFNETFDECIRMHLIADVPVGSFLSGGLDSSAIVATMSKHLKEPVKTFSVGFNWEGDELSQADAFAQRFNCDHHELRCSLEDFSNVGKLVWHLDEPVGDAIVLPMFLLAREARKKVKVVLTGEGADEILAGYFMHKVLNQACQYRQLLPGFLGETLVPSIVSMAPHQLLNKAFDYPASLGEKGKQRLLDYLSIVTEGNISKEYHFLISLMDDRDKQALYTSNMASYPLSNGARHSLANLNEILLLQFPHWLPDDILMKQDKMTMAHSLEGRVPFMDHKLVELACQMPAHLKLKNSRNKIALRRYLDKTVPGELSRRRKVPFYIPIDKYLTTPPFADFVADCLSESRIRKRGYFNPGYVRMMRESISDGEFLYGKQIFSLVMLELWHRIFIDREAGLM